MDKKSLRTLFAVFAVCVVIVCGVLLYNVGKGSDHINQNELVETVVRDRDVGDVCGEEELEVTGGVPGGMSKGAVALACGGTGVGGLVAGTFLGRYVLCKEDGSKEIKELKEQIAKLKAEGGDTQKVKDLEKKLKDLENDVKNGDAREKALRGTLDAFKVPETVTDSDKVQATFDQVVKSGVMDFFKGHDDTNKKLKDEIKRLETEVDTLKKSVNSGQQQQVTGLTGSVGSSMAGASKLKAEDAGGLTDEQFKLCMLGYRRHMFMSGMAPIGGGGGRVLPSSFSVFKRDMEQFGADGLNLMGGMQLANGGEYSDNFDHQISSDAYAPGQTNESFANVVLRSCRDCLNGLYILFFAEKEMEREGAGDYVYGTGRVHADANRNVLEDSFVRLFGAYVLLLGLKHGLMEDDSGVGFFNLRRDRAFSHGELLASDRGRDFCMGLMSSCKVSKEDRDFIESIYPEILAMFFQNDRKCYVGGGQNQDVVGRVPLTQVLVNSVVASGFKIVKNSKSKSEIVRTISYGVYDVIRHLISTAYSEGCVESLVRVYGWVVEKLAGEFEEPPVVVKELDDVDKAKIDGLIKKMVQNGEYGYHVLSRAEVKDFLDCIKKSAEWEVNDYIVDMRDQSGIKTDDMRITFNRMMTTGDSSMGVDERKGFDELVQAVTQSLTPAPPADGGVAPQPSIHSVDAKHLSDLLWFLLVRGASLTSDLRNRLRGAVGVTPWIRWAISFERGLLVEMEKYVKLSESKPRLSKDGIDELKRVTNVILGSGVSEDAAREFYSELLSQREGLDGFTLLTDLQVFDARKVFILAGNHLTLRTPCILHMLSSSFEKVPVSDHEMGQIHDTLDGRSQEDLMLIGTMLASSRRAEIDSFMRMPEVASALKEIKGNRGNEDFFQGVPIPDTQMCVNALNSANVIEGAVRCGFIRRGDDLPHYFFHMLSMFRIREEVVRECFQKIDRLNGIGDKISLDDAKGVMKMLNDVRLDISAVSNPAYRDKLLCFLNLVRMSSLKHEDVFGEQIKPVIALMYGISVKDKVRILETNLAGYDDKVVSQAKESVCDELTRIRGLRRAGGQGSVLPDVIAEHNGKRLLPAVIYIFCRVLSLD